MRRSLALGFAGASRRARNSAYALGPTEIRDCSSKASSAARRAAARMKSVRLVPRAAAARSIRPRSSARMRMFSVSRGRAWGLLTGSWRQGSTGAMTSSLRGKLGNHEEMGHKLDKAPRNCSTGKWALKATSVENLRACFELKSQRVVVLLGDVSLHEDSQRLRALRRPGSLGSIWVRAPPACRNRAETLTADAEVEATRMGLSIPTIQAAATAGILEHTERGGGDVHWVVAQAKLTFDELARPEQRLPLSSFVRLIEAASSATRDDCFGAHLGEICSLRELGLPGYLATFAPDVQSALSSFARYYYLLGDATDVRFETQDGVASFTYCVLDPESWPRRQDAEQVITMIVMLVRQWASTHWSPQRVCFEHGRPAQASEISRIFGCPVRFDCHSNTVCFTLADAAKKNPHADPKLFRLLSWFAETITKSTTWIDSRKPISFKEQVLFSIDTCANLGNVSIHSVARALGLEARTFQRRLRSEQTSFSDLQEEYRSRQAIKLLDHAELTEKDVANRLGYASSTSFIRAFRRWYGVTPGQFRERRAANSHTHS